MPAKVVNDDALCLSDRVVQTLFASKLAPTSSSYSGSGTAARDGPYKKNGHLLERRPQKGANPGTFAYKPQRINNSTNTTRKTVSPTNSKMGLIPTAASSLS